MRLPLVLSVVLCALVVAPGASAKGSAPSRVCGSSGCVRIADSPGVIISLYAAAERAEPPPQRFYRVHYAAVPPHNFVPSRDLVGTTAEDERRWFEVDEPALSPIRAAARRLEPYPESGSWTVPPRHFGESSTPALLAGALLVAAAAVAAGARRFIRLR